MDEPNKANFPAEIIAGVAGMALTLLIPFIFLM
jgi:hypothetical protein